MTDGWESERFKVGDVVVDVDRPHWGKGTVVADDTARSSSASGQKLHIDFEKRGRVIVLTGKQVLRRAEA